MAAKKEIDPYGKVSSPRIFLVRMAVFLVLAALVCVLLYRPIWTAFLANPGLNGIILGTLLIGILLALRQVLRLFPEIEWVNGFRLADPRLAVNEPPASTRRATWGAISPAFWSSSACSAPSGACSRPWARSAR